MQSYYPFMMHYSAEHSLSGGSFYLFFLFCAVLTISIAVYSLFLLRNLK